MSEDAELLRQYAQSGSETAFAELVRRYLPLVYATALRQGNGDEAMAKDVAQTVFIDLARKASSLLGRELLAGWLYTSTRLAASMAVRGDRRRQLREQIAASMQERTTRPESQPEQNELRLVLDEAMSELDAGERNAVLIRFFQGKELKEVGSALGISEDAARMRITRALDRLHGLLSQRGVTLSVAALGTALAAQAAIAVPSGLAASITATALTGVAAGGFGVGVLKYLALTKTKLLILAGITAFAAGLLVLTRLTSSGRAMTASSLPAKAGAFVPFSAQGALRYEVPGYPVLHRRFTVSVSNAMWHISVVMDGVSGLSSLEYRYDGTNNLQYATFEKSGPNVGSGSVETGPVPSFTSTDAGAFIWLTYAAGSYFHTLKAGTATSLEPLRSPNGLIARQEVPAEWKLAREAPFFPIEIRYFATNVAVLDDTSGVMSIPLEKAHRPKYVASHLRTWDGMPFEGMTIPRHFECTNYAPWPQPGTPGIGCIVRGYATNVCALIPFPKLPATLHLQDKRVPGPAVVYEVTDGNVSLVEAGSMPNARDKGLKVIDNRLRPEEPEPGRTHTTTIPGTWSWNVESNHMGGGQDADFWWERAQDNTNGYLVPVNGAKAAIVGDQKFERIDSDYVRHANLSEERIPGEALKPGVVLVFRTAKGRVGELQVVGYKALHDFDFPEAAYLTEEWRQAALGKPDVCAYHLQVRWTLLK